MMRITRKQKGFTLIELLIVVAIIGILAAIAIPNLLTAMQRSKQKRTMADLRTIATAWESRATDLNCYNASAQTAYTFPPTAVTEAQLSTALSPTYVRTFPSKDGWGNLWGFGMSPAAAAWNRKPGSTDVAAQAYGIRSSGKDGEFHAYTEGATTNFDCDIVYSNGSFIVYPEGVQAGQ